MRKTGIEKRTPNPLAWREGLIEKNRIMERRARANGLGSLEKNNLKLLAWRRKNRGPPKTRRPGRVPLLSRPGESPREWLLRSVPSQSGS